MSEQTSLRGRLRELSRDEAGLTPAQIIVALVGFGIMVTAGVFSAVALIIWHQDNTAKTDLEAIIEGQNTLAGAGDPYSDQFGEEGRSMTATSLAGGCYTALSASVTGAVYYADSKSGELDELTSDVGAECVSESQVQLMMDELGVLPEVIEARSVEDRLDYVRGITAAPVSISTGGAGTWQLQWRAVDSASQYQVYSTSGGTEELVATVPGTAFPSYEFTTGFGGGENFRIVAIAAGLQNSHPMDYGFTTLPQVITNGTFERGFMGWEAGRIVEDEAERYFVEDERSYAGTITPEANSGNDSRAVAEVRQGDAIRSEAFELSAGDAATISFDARLTAGSEWMVEFFDADMEPVATPNQPAVMIAPGTGNVGQWRYHGPTAENADANLFTAPDDAKFGRLVLIGSGTTAQQAAQFDNIDVSYR